ncbi:MAG TPA: hypothetical protein VEM93_02770 [Actinomycetota bacterium]|nr:hypothetical protein [Actinomycetota bacterium]
MDLFGFSTLAGHFSPGWGAAAGIAGGLAFLAVVYMGLGSGMTRMNFLHILGTMMVPRASRKAAHVAFGVVTGSIYAAAVL